MRYFLLVLCLLHLSCGQENFVTVSGKFKNMDGVAVALTFEEKVLKTDTVRNGALNLVVRIPANRVFKLSFKDPNPEKYIDGLPVYSAPTITLFSSSNDESFLISADATSDLYDIDKYTVDALRNQIEYHSYQSLLKKDRLNNEIKLSSLTKIQDLALATKNDSLYTLYSDSLRFQERFNKTTHNVITRSFIAEHPNSYISMYLLSKRTDLKSNLAFYQLLYNKADRKYRKSWYGLFFAKRVEQLEKLREKYITKLYVDAFDLNNVVFNYEKYKGSKLIVFDLWATWCIPCMEDMPSAIALAKKLEQKSVSYVFLSYDFNDQYWKQQSKKLGLINSYYLSDQTRKFLSEELQVVSIPRYMILNNKGEILVVDAPSPSSPALEKLLESML